MTEEFSVVAIEQRKTKEPYVKFFSWFHDGGIVITNKTKNIQFLDAKENIIPSSFYLYQRQTDQYQYDQYFWECVKIWNYNYAIIFAQKYYNYQDLHQKPISSYYLVCRKQFVFIDLTSINEQLVDFNIKQTIIIDEQNLILLSEESFCFWISINDENLVVNKIPLKITFACKFTGKIAFISVNKNNNITTHMFDIDQKIIINNCGAFQLLQAKIFPNNNALLLTNNYEIYFFSWIKNKPIICFFNTHASKIIPYGRHSFLAINYQSQSNNAFLINQYGEKIAIGKNIFVAYFWKAQKSIIIFTDHILSNKKTAYHCYVVNQKTLQWKLLVNGKIPWLLSLITDCDTFDQYFLIKGYLVNHTNKVSLMFDNNLNLVFLTNPALSFLGVISTNKLLLTNYATFIYPIALVSYFYQIRKENVVANI